MSYLPPNAKYVLTLAFINALAKLWHYWAAILKIQRKSIEIENIYFLRACVLFMAILGLLGCLSHSVMK
jgi:hypothetical protein